jgi:hypothetical protein
MKRNPASETAWSSFSADPLTTERSILHGLRRPGFLAPALTIVLVLFAGSRANAEQTAQFWPKIDTYVKIDHRFRLLFNASTTQESGSDVGSQFGANLDIFVKSHLKLKRFTVFQLDESKSRLLTFRIGYNYLPTPGKPPENRVSFDATPRFPLKAGVSVADRNRMDLRFINGKFSWRYRNRLMVERSFGIRSYHFTPYVRGEAYYDSNPDKWSRTTEDVGCLFPIHRRAEIEPYYQHMNDTSKSPNQQTHGVGLTLSLYF